MQPIQLSEDRSMLVGPGKVVKTGYALIDDIILDCKASLSIGHIERAYNKRIQLGDSQPWTCPVGYWQDGRFHITDGRHDFVACLILGLPHILVAWIE